MEGLVEETWRECWQCLQEERGRAGSQQRSQESEFEGHGGPRGLDMKKAGAEWAPAYRKYRITLAETSTVMATAT